MIMEVAYPGILKIIWYCEEWKLIRVVRQGFHLTRYDNDDDEMNLIDWMDIRSNLYEIQNGQGRYSTLDYFTS